MSDLTRLTLLLAEKLLKLEMHIMADITVLNANTQTLTASVAEATTAVNNLVSAFATLKATPAAPAVADIQPQVDAVAQRLADLQAAVTAISAAATGAVNG